MHCEFNRAQHFGQAGSMENGQSDTISHSFSFSDLILIDRNASASCMRDRHT